MRIVKQYLYCDRCKKDLSLADYSSSREVNLKSTDDEITVCDTLDLCRECTISFWEWMDNYKKEDKNNGSVA